MPLVAASVQNTSGRLLLKKLRRSSEKLKMKYYRATSKTWTQTLDPDLNPDTEKPGPCKTWTLKNLDLEKPGPQKTWTLKIKESKKQL